MSPSQPLSRLQFRALVEALALIESLHVGLTLTSNISLIPVFTRNWLALTATVLAAVQWHRVRDDAHQERCEQWRRRLWHFRRLRDRDWCAAGALNSRP